MDCHTNMFKSAHWNHENSFYNKHSTKLSASEDSTYGTYSLNIELNLHALKAIK